MYTDRLFFKVFIMSVVTDYLKLVVDTTLDLGKQAAQAEIKDHYTPDAPGETTARTAGTVTDEKSEVGSQMEKTTAYWYPFGEVLPVHKGAIFVTVGVIGLLVVGKLLTGKKVV